MANNMTLQQVRAVIQRLLAEGAVVAELDGTTHTIFPVAISAETGAALRS